MDSELGTFLTENLYSLAYNYASEDGNTATVEGLNAYNLQTSEVCANSTAQIITQRATKVEFLARVL